MGRKHRDLATSTWFHVYNRGADRQDIFSHPADFALFERLVALELGQQQVEVHAYALMTNHFHLMVDATHGDLSVAMQRLTGRYGAAYNQRTGREGPVFTGRFGSVPVDSDEQAQQLGRYIHRNPLAFRSPEDLAAYPWSSFSSLCGHRVAPEWLRTDVVTAGMGPAAYQTYVLTPQPSDATDSWTPPPIAIGDIEHGVATAFGCAVSDVCRPSFGVDRADRTLLAMLTVECRATSTADLAERLGLNDASSVRQLARRGRVRLARDVEFALLYDAVRSSLNLSRSGSGPDRDKLGSGG